MARREEQRTANIRLKEILKRRAPDVIGTVVLLTSSGASNPFFLKLRTCSPRAESLLYYPQPLGTLLTSN
ncbi:MAG: hypothetical protein RI955_1120 [Bacteroidota bacterium]